jgi:hypothetical protein
MGWAADGDDFGAAVTLIITVNGVDVGRVIANRYREGLKSIASEATGYYDFRFVFAEKLSPFRRYAIAVRAVRGDRIIDPGVIELRPAHEADAPAIADPISPLFIRSICPDSTRVLLRLLAEHPDVIVAGQGDRGAMPTMRYATVFRHLPGFPEQLGQEFHDVALFERTIFARFPEKLAAFLRAAIIDFYTAAAADQKKPKPAWFAEGWPAEPVAAEADRSLLFPEARDILLVRDIRDLLGDAGTDDAARVAAAARGMVKHAKAQAEQSLILRLEDLAARPRMVLDRVAAWLELASGFAAPGQQALPMPPQRGAWTIAIDNPNIAEAFASYQRHFGYDQPDDETSRPAQGALAAEDAPAASAELTELMMGFESLGENCEFGLVQRRCGAEPLGLFRFASAPLPKLLAALAARFEALADPANLDVRLSENGKEFMVEDRRFGLLYHAWVMAGEMSAEQVREREVNRLPLLVRKLVEELEAGEKIFVYHGMSPMALEEALALAAAIGRYGSATLLWVEQAGPSQTAGHVEWVTPTVLKGHIDRFAPGENAHDLSLDGWIAVCRRAAEMHRTGRAGSPLKPTTPAKGRKRATISS